MKLTTVLLAIALTSCGFAADLVIKNGTKFENYRIASQTADAVMVFHKKGASKVFKHQLPAELLAQYPYGAATEYPGEPTGQQDFVVPQAAPAAPRRASTPATQDQLILAEVERLKTLGHNTASAYRLAKEKYGLNTKQAVADLERAEQKQRAKQEKAAQKAEDDLEKLGERVLAAVETAAKNHFKTSRQNGSGQALVFDVSVEMDEPEAIQGWTGRYRVSGTIFYQMYDSVYGGSFSGRRGSFEALVETKDNIARPKVTEFSAR